MLSRHVADAANSEDLRKCFDPVIENIIGLIEEQVAAVAKENAPRIKVKTVRC